MNPLHCPRFHLWFVVLSSSQATFNPRDSDLSDPFSARHSTVPGRVGTGKITSHTALRNCPGLLRGLQTLYLHPALINMPHYRADRKSFPLINSEQGGQRMQSSSKQVMLIARIMFSCVFRSSLPQFYVSVSVETLFDR